MIEEQQPNFEIDEAENEQPDRESLTNETKRTLVAAQVMQIMDGDYTPEERQIIAATFERLGVKVTKKAGAEPISRYQD